jgi:HD-GYP domain-containing protein (c-di-GMP phosphodiesterase class II)
MMPARDENKEVFQLVAGLSAAIAGLRLYAEKHPKANALLDQTYADIVRRAAGREKTTVLIVEDELLWDGTALKAKTHQLQPFVELLRNIGVESISFHKGISRSEINEFLKALASNQADFLPSSAHIKLGKLQLNSKDSDPAPLGEAEQERVATFLSLRDENYPQVKEICHQISRQQALNIKGVEAVVMAFVRGLVHSINPIRLLIQMKLEDEYTYTHMVNVCILTMCQAEFLGFSAKFLSPIGVAALLHDVGKLFIPPEILNKPGKLADEERLIIEAHPLRGACFILKNDTCPRLAVLGALEHHIKYDGTGYPSIWTSYQPNIVSQMIAIADVFDALRTRRSYKAPKPVTDIVSVLQKEKGSAYHPRLVDNFLKLIKEGDCSNAVITT